MKHIILIILTLIASVTFGQTEKPTNKTVTENFVKNYNADNYKVVFSMFAKVMQQALPIDKTTEFLTGLKLQAGNITNQQFIKYENGTYASYKATFERATFILNISIDENSKINGLFVKPFIEEGSLENLINNLSIADAVITQQQSDIIFKNSKIFPNQTQIAIAVINNGDVSYYGIKRNNDMISTFDNHQSIFEIGSITKVFTATLLAGFVIDKKVKLDDNINDYLSLSLNNNPTISFKQLANHTSGLPPLPLNLNLSLVNPANPYKEYKKRDLESYLTELLEVPQKSIGKYQYSNLGLGILGYTLSKIANTSYDSLLQTKIFSKYNMLSSTTNINNINGVLVKGLDVAGNEVSNWDLAVLAGAGGIISSVEDLAKFVVAQFDNSNKELELSRQKTFVKNNNMDVGLGWHIIKAKSGNSWYWHSGGTGGYSSSMSIDIKNKNGIIILSNVSAFNPGMGNIDKLCFELMATLEKE
ncbi:Beta-lactamase class C-like and penicillin binding proteins (PBPs) superfamily [hydrothermal vent metagenome]|uniref:Beta-lactamase class C-like and penicillin binding proteins (PBPs) superfamily n=1 Tax=hydrothermal vent metagenome TaxID=652676 RepID=A0A3B0V6J7_9ZZZZ